MIHREENDRRRNDKHIVKDVIMMELTIILILTNIFVLYIFYVLYRKRIRMEKQRWLSARLWHSLKYNQMPKKETQKTNRHDS